jgi:hypothetical protein
LSRLMGVGQNPARNRLAMSLVLTVSLTSCTAAWPCIPDGAVVVRGVDESKDVFW